MNTVSGVSSTYLVTAAVKRALELMAVLDREHTPADLYPAMRGVRQELQAAGRLLGDEPRPGNRTGLERRARGTTQNSQRYQLLKWMCGSRGGTVSQIAGALGIGEATVRSRMCELDAAGWVTPYAQVSSPHLGRKRTWWKPTETGFAALGRLTVDQLELPIT